MIYYNNKLNMPLLLQACLLHAAVCLLQVSVMTESERGTSQLFKTSKIIKIGLEYKKLEQNEDRICFGKFRKYCMLKTRKKVYIEYIKIN